MLLDLGNGLIIDPVKERIVIRPKNGFGGIGGPGIKPIALSNVNMFYSLLTPKVDIIGCGGISTGIDVFEHILAGASAVQIGTVLVENGPKCFQNITEELEVIMDKKGYKSIKEFQGNLQPLDN